MVRRNSYSCRSLGLRCGVLLSLCLGFLSAPSAIAEQPQTQPWQPTKLLPDTVVAYAELSNLGDGIQTVIQHPLRKPIEAMPAYQAILQAEGYSQVEQGIAAFEGAMDMPWQEALATLSDGGVAIALDAEEGGVAILAKSSSEEKLKRFRGFLTVIRQLQPGDSKRGGTYRGFTAEPLGDKLKLAVINDLLLITNNSNLGKAIIDRYLDADESSFQTSERFQTAWSTIGPAAEGQASASGYVDVQAIREGGLAKDLFKEKTENPLEELLLGGIFSNLQHTPYATARLDLQDQGLRLRLATPHQRNWEPPREYYFGEPQPIAAPPLLAVSERLFAVSSHRDFSQMWLRAPDLMSDKANDGLAQADTQLTTFFSGRDFGEDILGSLEGDIQVVGKAQNFQDVLPRPAIKLPAFAIQFRMRDPEETQPELRRVFQSFIGFLNVVGAMEGQAQFDLDSQTIGDAKLYTATYVPDRDLRDSTDAPINFNFSPTIAFQNDRIIISSATQLAQELVDVSQAAAKPASSGTPSPTDQEFNTLFTLDAKTLQDVLRTNKDQLVAQSMLEKGHSKETAESETDLLLDMIGFLQNFQIDLKTADGQLQLTGELNLNVDRTE